MSFDALLTALILGAAVAFLAADLLRARSVRLWLPLAIGAVALVALVFLQRGPLRPPPSEAEIAERPIEVPAQDYVSSDTCRSCHPREYESWRSSYHRTMTQVPTPETISPSFDGVELEDRYRYRLETRGDELWAASDDPRFGGGGKWVERRVRMTTGSHHAQLFWLETGDGRRLELFPFGYRIAEQRWLPFLSAFLAPKADETQAALVDTNWSTTCIRCHATNPRPRVAGPDQIDSHVSEFGISCEACHGPGGDHVAAQRDPLTRYATHLGLREADSHIVEPTKLTHERSSQVCAQCHSVSTEFDPDHRLQVMRTGNSFRPGDDFGKSRNVLRNDGTPQIPYVEDMLKHVPDYLDFNFWPDGEVAVSGREYNGLTDSPCYLAGELSCFSCHQLHQSSSDPRDAREWADDQLQAGMDGNEACLQCHEGFASEIESHTHHASDSSGSECMNCHMPNTAYGLLKATRSHKITNPSVASSLESGRANACNLCHLDKTLAWTAQAQHDWWGTPVPELSADEREVAASLLWLLRGHAGQRAVIVWNMGWEPAREASGTEWMTPFLIRSIGDPYEAIRFLADRSLTGTPGWDRESIDHLAPENERTRIRWEAMEDWRKTPRSRTGRAILIGDDGRPMEEEIERLLRQRDQRLVYRPE